MIIKTRASDGAILTPVARILVHPVFSTTHIEGSTARITSRRWTWTMVARNGHAIARAPHHHQLKANALRAATRHAAMLDPDHYHDEGATHHRISVEVWDVVPRQARGRRGVAAV